MHRFHVEMAIKTRLAKGLSPPGLAKKANIKSAQTIRDYEGGLSVPDPATAARVAAALELEPEDLYTDLPLSEEFKQEQQERLRQKQQKRETNSKASNPRNDAEGVDLAKIIANQTLDSQQGLLSLAAFKVVMGQLSTNPSSEIRTLLAPILDKLTERITGLSERPQATDANGHIGKDTAKETDGTGKSAKGIRII